jgi:Invasin, domain 3
MGGFGIDAVARSARAAAAIGTLCVGILAGQAAPASAAGQFESFAATATSSQAGGHPDLGIALSLANPGSPETAKILTLDAPQGLTAYLNSIPPCSLADLATGECVPASQVGLATTRAAHDGTPDFLFGTAPVYAIRPAGDEYGRLAFTIPTLGFTQSMQAAVRTGGDYGVRLTIPNLPSAAPLQGLGLLLWGSPADPSHDAARFPRGSAGCPGLADASCLTEPTPSSAPIRPLVGYPPACGGQPLPLTLELQTYQDPAHLTTATAGLPAATGCNLLPFNPSVFVQSSPSTRTGTFFNLDLRVPQPVTPTGLTPSAAKSTFIDLGGALLLDRAAADRHAACGEAEAAIGTDAPPACPASAKLGTVRINTPVAPEASGGPFPFNAEAATGGGGTRVAIPQIAGSVYFGGPEPGGGYRLYLLPSGFGIQMKLQMLLQPDPESGQLIVSLPALPQFPIAEIDLHLPATSGVIRTAVLCGSYSVGSTITPWSFPQFGFQLTQPLILSTGPGGTPCPGPPAQAQVELTPAQVIADGRSSTTATALVSDQDGIPVPGEQVEFSSTDPGERIGPVTDHEDGTYSAQIIASTTVGTPTITATIKSAEPELSASALLQQLPVPTPAPPAASEAAVPKVRIGKHPRRRSRRRSAVFTFAADVPGSTFYCKLDSRAYRRCTSPTTLTNLAAGKHRFSVYAVSPSGGAGDPAILKFKVLPPKRN